MKNWFRGSQEPTARQRVDVDALIAQGQLDQALTQLRARLRKNQDDLYSRLKLADVLMRMNQQREAVDEYLLAAESYGRDGFFDKAAALLRRISKMAPSNTAISAKLEALDRAKNLERRREAILGGLAKARSDRGSATSAVEWQQVWNNLSQTPLVENLSDDQVRRLFRASDLARFGEGDTVAEAGEQKEEIYLVTRGSIEVRIPLKGGHETTIRSFGGGDVIGDRSLLEHQPWPARYVAAKKTTVLKLNGEGLSTALQGENDPKGFLEVLRSQKQDHQVLSSIRELEQPG